MTSEASAEAAIHVRGLVKRFAKTWALKRVTFRLPAGRCLLVAGPNGAGKSTLIGVLGTLLRPTGGSADVFGQSVTEAAETVRRSVGILTHEPMLYPHLTVTENLRFFGCLFTADDLGGRVAAALETFELTDEADAPVGALSHGTVQRTALARAMLHQPRALLLDEPFAGLDERGRALLRSELVKLREGGVTVVLTAHEPQPVADLVDTVAVLSAAQLRGYEHQARWSERDIQKFYHQSVARPVPTEERT